MSAWSYRDGFAPVDPSTMGSSIDPVTMISPVLVNGRIRSDDCGIVGITKAFVVTTPLPPPVRGNSPSPRFTTSIWFSDCQWAFGAGNTCGAWSMPRLTGLGATGGRVGAAPEASVNTTGSGDTGGVTGRAGASALGNGMGGANGAAATTGARVGTGVGSGAGVGVGAGAGEASSGTDGGASSAWGRVPCLISSSRSSRRVIGRGGAASCEGTESITGGGGIEPAAVGRACVR